MLFRIFHNYFNKISIIILEVIIIIIIKIFFIKCLKV